MGNTCWNLGLHGSLWWSTQGGTGTQIPRRMKWDRPMGRTGSDVPGLQGPRRTSAFLHAHLNAFPYCCVGVHERDGMEKGCAEQWPRPAAWRQRKQELSPHLLEVEPTGSACGLTVSMNGATKRNPQAFVGQLVVRLRSHSNGNPQCKESFLLVDFGAHHLVFPFGQTFLRYPTAHWKCEFKRLDGTGNAVRGHWLHTQVTV